MIYYWLNLIYVYLGSKYFWTKIKLDSELTRTRRVSILDCDSLRFMANSKYFYYMDFVRFEVMFRSNLYKKTFKKGIFPILGSQKIIYKKPLKRWTKFKVTIVLEGWDDKWGYHSHVFKQNKEICAIGYTKFAFWKDKSALHLPSIFADCGVAKEDFDPPSEILNLFKNDNEIIKSYK